MGMTIYHLGTKEGLEALREAWKKVGTSRRAHTSNCGICGCRSNLWRTYGSVMMGIREFLVCPGEAAYPEIHDKIELLKDALWEDKLPDSIQEEIVIEIQRLLAKFASVKSDIQDGSAEGEQ